MTNGSGRDGFAPSDYSDSRARWEWESRYPPDARKEIKLEALYCGLLLILAPVGIWFASRNPLANALALDPSRQNAYPILIIAWLGGTFGGTIYTTKWLNHVVGKGRWHQDRRLWRILTPIISGGVSFAFIALATSNVLPILSFDSIGSVSSLIGISFLLGYFSDTVVGKLAEVAGVLFGTVKDHEPSEPEDMERYEGEGEEVPKQR